MRATFTRSQAASSRRGSSTVMCISNRRTCCRTTTIFCDPHELANVLGVAGARYAVEASRGLPLRFIVQASSCVPAAPGLEVSGADFAAPEIRELLSWPEIAGLAEVMDMRAVLETHPRMVGILAEAHASGKIIEGHARGLTGPALQAYM